MRCFFFSLFLTYTLAEQRPRGEEQRKKERRDLLPHSPRKKYKTERKMEMRQEEGELDLLEQPSTLTDKDVVMIQESWIKVYENHMDNGAAILMRFFTDFPSSMKFFKDFKHIERIEELQNNDKLKKHGERVMNLINDVIVNLYNSEKVALVLNGLGKSHALRHHVEPIYFKILSGVILTVLKEAFSEVVTSEVAAAWTKLLANLYSAVKAAYDEVGWIKGSASTSK
ncbi:cytoglobin-1-like [Antennarius striatus]|uniref:cytoglobin-1-like n=1 Tax=Antennarius striatus TaxID=241820 RepID=UPI0035AE1A56